MFSYHPQKDKNKRKPANGVDKNILEYKIKPVKAAKVKLLDCKWIKLKVFSKHKYIGIQTILQIFLYYRIILIAQFFKHSYKQENKI